MHALVRLGVPHGPQVDAPSASTRLPRWSPPPTSPSHATPLKQLLDHLIRLEQERGGQCQPQGLGRLEIEDQLVLPGRFDRQVSGFGSVTNSCALTAFVIYSLI